MVEDVCPLSGTGQNRPYPLLPPCPTWRSCKCSSSGEACRQKFLVSVDADFGLELLATTITDKHMATVLPNCVLVRGSKRAESLVTDITGVNPSLSFALSTHTDPILILMSTPLHGLLKADPSL